MEWMEVAEDDAVGEPEVGEVAVAAMAALKSGRCCCCMSRWLELESAKPIRLPWRSGVLEEAEEGVDECCLMRRRQQQQHSRKSRTRTKKIPPAAAPTIMAMLVSSLVPPGRPTLKK